MARGSHGKCSPHSGISDLSRFAWLLLELRGALAQKKKSGREKVSRLDRTTILEGFHVCTAARACRRESHAAVRYRGPRLTCRRICSRSDIKSSTTSRIAELPPAITAAIDNDDGTTAQNFCDHNPQDGVYESGVGRLWRDPGSLRQVLGRAD